MPPLQAELLPREGEGRVAGVIGRVWVSRGRAVACATGTWLAARLWNASGLSPLLTWVCLWTTLTGCGSGPSLPRCE